MLEVRRIRVKEAKAMVYELLRVGVRPASLAEALKRIGACTLKRPGASLLGFWYPEHGLLNQLISLWSCEVPVTDDPGPDAAHGFEWVRAIGEFVTGISREHFRMFPYLPEVRPGTFGPYYELREYRVDTGTVPRTMDLWKEWVEKRAQLSPVVAVMYPLGGALDRFVHIWGYRSLDERVRLRAQAIEKGLWPPPGAAQLVSMQESTILLPAPFSPLK